MKNLVIAILIAILITYTFGHVAAEWFDISIQIDEEVLTPVAAMAGLTIAGIVLVVVGVVVALSVFGAIFFAVMAVFIGLLFAGLSVFWPMFIVIALVVWLVRDKRPAHY